MDKKYRVWLVVLAFLLIVVLSMCVFFKLKLDDISEKYDDAMIDVVNDTEAMSEDTKEADEAETSGKSEDYSENESVEQSDAAVEAEATDKPYVEVETVDESTTANDEVNAVEDQTHEYTPEQIAAMREELDASRAREVELEAEVERLRSEVDLYRSDDPSKMVEQGADVSGMSETTAVDESGAVEKPATAENGEADAELKLAIEEKESLGAELDAVKAENESLSAELDAAKAENETLEAELNTAVSENEDLSSKIETISAENERLNGEMEAAYSENELLSSALDDATTSNGELGEQLEAALADNERLAGELDVANAQLDVVDMQLRAYRGDAEYELSDIINVAADGMSAEYHYACSASEGNFTVCELSIADEVIFVSDKMVSGDSIEGFVLIRPLESGSHEALLTELNYRQDGSIASRISMPVMVVVQK